MLVLHSYMNLYRKFDLVKNGFLCNKFALWRQMHVIKVCRFYFNAFPI